MAAGDATDGLEGSIRSEPTVLGLLFADIEGSTRLLARLGSSYDDLLAAYHRVLSDAVSRAGGSVALMEGDGVFAVFPTGTGTVAAAVDAQRELVGVEWPGSESVAARMGLHIGEVRTGPAGHVGMAIHEAARLSAAAHGGQVLLSGALHGVVADALPAGVQTVDLGRHRLKDLAEPHHVWQMEIDGLPTEFPPIRSLEGRSHNFPVHLTSFVGRERELAEICELLGTRRLVTLTGAGGAGKTRLSLHAGAAVLDEHLDGVWFVELAALTDPHQVPASVARALGLRERRSTLIDDALRAHLRNSRLLLILDNCEHLVAAAASLVEDVLLPSPGVTVMATSREPLGVAGEVTYRVPSLGLPKHGTDDPTAPAVQLFLDRAGAARPGLVLDGTDLAAVAEVCRRLDGIPLALELAAARVKVLSPRQIESRLDDALRLLTTGSRTAPSRHRTLRAAIEWSHDLLTNGEQVMLRRLSVFAGGFTLEAVEDVCAVPPLDDADVVDILMRLVDASLVAVGGPEPRYEVPTTIRLFAAERLGESGEEDVVRARHAGYFRRLVLGGGADLAPADQAEWLAGLDADHDDLAAAIRWAIDRRDATLAVGLAGDLARFWYRRGYYGEAHNRLREVLSMPDLPPSEDLANVLRFAAATVMSAGDTAGALELADRAEAAAREVGIPVLMARCHNLRGGIAWRTGDYGHAAARYREAIGLLDEDDPFLVRLYVNLAGVLTGSGALEEAEAALLAVERSPALESRDVVVGTSTRGWLEYARGDLDAAEGTFTDAVAVMRELGLKPDLAWALKLAAQVSVARGHLDTATSLATESQVLHTEIDDVLNAAEADQVLAEIAVARGDVAGAAETMARVLRLFRDTGRCAEAAETLAGFIAVAVAGGDWLAAARLLGARARALDDLGIVPPAPRRIQQAAWERAVTAALGEAAFAEEHSTGFGLGLAEATDFALSSFP